MSPTCSAAWVFSLSFQLVRKQQEWVWGGEGRIYKKEQNPPIIATRTQLMKTIRNPVYGLYLVSPVFQHYLLNGASVKCNLLCTHTHVSSCRWQTFKTCHGYSIFLPLWESYNGFLLDPPVRHQLDPDPTQCQPNDALRCLENVL